MRIPKNPYQLLKIRWLDACSHEEANRELEGVIRETVGFQVREGKDVLRICTTVDFDESKGEWTPTDQANEINDIPYGMIRSRRKL